MTQVNYSELVLAATLECHLSSHPPASALSRKQSLCPMHKQHKRPSGHTIISSRTRYPLLAHRTAQNTKSRRCFHGGTLQIRYMLTSYSAHLASQSSALPTLSHSRLWDDIYGGKGEKGPTTNPYFPPRSRASHLACKSSFCTFI